DDNILELYGGYFPGVPVLTVKPGEDSKTLTVIERLAGKMLDKGIDRSGFLVAIGGGVVCDIGGFLASIYMRGIRCGYVSTSLLSQVDASTGGKNGVDLGGTKNILGIIRQPEFVICDQSMLLTLPEEEYLSGLSELIKTAIIGDKELFGIIESGHDLIMKRDIGLLTDLVTRSVKFKASVVMEDEREAGLRRILNFGHTFGHAIEMQTSFRHGYAVASGMELAAWFSLIKGFINEYEKERITGMLEAFELLNNYNIDAGTIEHLISQDKKKTGKDIHFVFVSGIGKAVVEKVPVDELVGFYTMYREKKIKL
ncbi:MAG TPA: 3-dehydroquinate synthase, partial [Bacteroidales bacterium]|nr:3-dehydroquinate synthase [Bacteroidales bacterium]